MEQPARRRLDHGRRAFLRGRPRVPAPLRPPWALDEECFVDACTGCGDCIAACPARVLVRGEGGMPVFDPALGECTFCSKCVTACGEYAFDATDQRPWTLQPRIDGNCLAASGVVCSSCRDACGESAIAFPVTAAVPVPELMAARCNGCGACVSGCPVAAISLVAMSSPEIVDG